MQPDEQNQSVTPPETNPTAPATQPVEFGAAEEVADDETAVQDRPLALPETEPLTWQADEYVQHDKDPMWYVGFGAVVLVLMVLAILLMKTWTFAVLVPVMAAALLVYTHRPPAHFSYAASQQGIAINGQLHPMGEFKSFGVRSEGDHNLLTLIPVKRFRPSTTVYFPTEVGEPLVDLLGAFMPMQDTPPDFLDRLIQRLRI